MATADTAPPRLPNVFITPETEPLKLPPMSRHMAQDTATVSSRPASASTSQNSAVVASCASTPGTSATAATVNPTTDTRTLPRRRSPQYIESLSEIQPPAALVTVAAT